MVSGIIDKIEEKKKLKAKEDVEKHALFIEWFEKYLNNIYTSFYTAEGKVTIKPGHEGGFVNLDSKEIVLFARLINDLWDSGIPPLLVFYHEIGHVLFTTKELNTFGQSLLPEVFILLNWLEDFYIEDKLIKTLYFVKPYIKMLHEIVPDFIDDWEKPHFAFHYYYIYEGITPKWMVTKGIDKQFIKYITQLKHLRTSFGSKFGREKFIKTFEDFYKFCVLHNIISKTKTPPPPLEPFDPPKEFKKELSKKGEALEDTKEEVTGDTYKDDEGEDVIDSVIERKSFKPRDEKFDPMFKELIELLSKEYDKALYNSFKLKKKGKPTLVPHTRSTASPRSMIDPIAIATARSDIYLEYTLEEFAYTAYNLFIDVSGSVGHNLTFNKIGKSIIDIIKHFTYAVYGYGNDVKQWDQEQINNILDLHCRDGTESPIIGDIILEKKELGNLNIILSDGDLSNLTRRSDIADITKQYLFIFIVCSGKDWFGYAKKYFAPNQYVIINTEKDFDKGIKALQEYINSKGL